MKNFNVIIMALLWGMSYVHAAPAKPKQQQRRAPATKLTGRQKGELSNAITNYKNSLLALQTLQQRGMQPSRDDIKKRNALKATIDRYKKDYPKDTFVMEHMQDLDMFLSEMAPALPAKGQDYSGKLTPPALPAKDQSYYGKLTPPALPERSQNYKEFMKNYKNQIILPNNQINRDWLAQASEAVRKDLGAIADRQRVEDTLWREIESTVDQYASSPLNAGNPSYKQQIKASYDEAFRDFWK